MFESYKIRRIVHQLISSPGQDNTSSIKVLKTFGADALEALVEKYKANKILGSDMEKYLRVYYDPQQMDLFFELFSDSKEQIRAWAQQTVMDKSGAAAVPRLIDLLKNGDFQQKRAAADLILKLGGRDIVGKIIPLLSEGDRELKRVVMNILAEAGGADASRYIIEQLKSNDWYIRKRAVEALSKIKDPASVKPLLELLDSEKDPKIKVSIIETLGETGDSETAHRILYLIRDDDMIVRQLVVEAMEKLADVSIVPDVLRLMKDAGVNVRRAAVEILRKIKDPKAADMLVEMLQDPDWWVREIATDALADIEKVSMTEKIISLFKSREENTRRAAVEYFNRAPTQEAFEPLLRMLKDHDWWVREKAVMALGKLGNERAVEPILELSSDPDVRWAVPQALGDIGGEKSLVYLGDFLGDPERSVRLAALKALGKIKDKASLPIIKGAVKDTDSEIRDTALDIIKEMTGHAVKANQIIAEQEREKWTGGSTVFSAVLPVDAKILSEAILVLDLCNSTEIGARYGDEFAMKLTSRLVAETKPLATKHRVRFTKSTGDGYLMTFSEIRNSLAFATDIMKIVGETNLTYSENERIDLRIAINVGETRLDDKGDRLGTAVNMTFRVEGVKPKDLIEDSAGMKRDDMPTVNRIFVTEAVNAEIERNGEFRSRFVGFFEMKGIQGRHRIYQVLLD